MDDGVEIKAPVPFTRRERADAVAKALADAARRSRLSRRHRAHLATNYLGTQRRSRSFRVFQIASFIALFLLPSLAVGAYEFFVAADQFVSETRFTVRGGLPPRLDTIGAITGLPSVLVMQDTEVILNFVASANMARKLDAAVGLKSLYSDPSVDYVSRLDPDASIEKFTKYWTEMLTDSVTMPTGIVALKIRAFRPEDAKRIAEATVLACENLINEMNDRMIRDTLVVSEAERERAEAGLTAARAALETARNAEGVLSADKTAEALNGLLTKVRGEIADMQQEYETQRHYVSDAAPQVRNLTIRLTAAKEAMRQLQANLTQSEDGGRPLSGAMSRLDYLNLENTVAERIYASALALLEHAQVVADSRLLSLSVSVSPAVAQEARYPRRALNTLGFTVAALCVWFAIVRVAAVLRNWLRAYRNTQIGLRA